MFDRRDESPDDISSNGTGSSTEREGSISIGSKRAEEEERNGKDGIIRRIGCSLH